MNLDKLPEYLRGLSNKEFEWGVHDCLIFTNNAWKEMYGYGWADDWVGRYMAGGKPLSKKQLKEEFGYKTFTEAVDARLTRIDYVPPRGALVATTMAKRWAIGHALGICVGTKAAFVSSQGIIYHPIETIDKAWIE